jgi:endogenous inhibitor of DNA gyrase (YacG/DUF329 family)
LRQGLARIDLVRTVRCPTCGVLVDWSTEPNRPFCSPRCRLLDLEGWANERFRIPGEEIPLDEERRDDQ